MTYCICWRIRLPFTLKKTGQKSGVILYAGSAARMPAGCAVILYVASATYSIYRLANPGERCIQMNTEPAWIGVTTSANPSAYIQADDVTASANPSRLLHVVCSDWQRLLLQSEQALYSFEYITHRDWLSGTYCM